MSQTPGMYPPPTGPENFDPGDVITAQIVPVQAGQQVAEAKKRNRIVLWVFAILGGSLLIVFAAFAWLAATLYHATGAPVAAAVRESQRVLFLPEFEARIGNPETPREIDGSRQLIAGKSLEVMFAQVGNKTQGRHVVRVENQGGTWVVTKSVVELNDRTEIDFKSLAAP